jgi:hypothetical protein
LAELKLSFRFRTDGGALPPGPLAEGSAAKTNARRSSAAWTLGNRKSIYFTNIETFTTYGM